MRMFPMITWAVAEPSAGKMAAFAWEECPLAPITDMGALNGFYRNTQLQGHLVQDGLYLDSVPEFWTTGSDFPYRKKESDKEAGMGYAVLTTRGSNVYLHIWNSTGTELCFAAMKNRVLSARFLDGGAPVAFEQKDNRLLFRGLPVPLPDSIATTIILQVEGEPEPITSQTSFWIPGEPAT